MSTVEKLGIARYSVTKQTPKGCGTQNRLIAQSVAHPPYSELPDDHGSWRGMPATLQNVCQGILQLRLMMNTVLSSIRSCSPIWRRRSSFFTAYSSRALQISFAGWRYASR